MVRGILDTIGLAGTVLFAAPVALLGFDFLLLQGRPLGGLAFLAIAVLMVVVPRHLRTPGDVAGETAGRVADAVVVDPDEED